MPLENYCVHVPCRAYIAKYYYSIWGNPFDLNLKSNFTDELVSRIHHEPIKKLPDYNLNTLIDSLNSDIKFRLPIDFLYRVDEVLTRQKIWNINKYLINSFHEDLLLIVNMGVCFGVERRTSIESFANKYGIILEEDITLEALKKSEYRLRQSNSFKNKFLAVLSSPEWSMLRA